MSVRAKICGLTSEGMVDAAVEAGAAMTGFVFFPASPRALTPERAAALAARVPAGVTKVALSVDADDALLAEIVEAIDPGLLQLHGDETPERVAEIREAFGVPVMKVIAIAGPDDVARARTYERVADMLMFDAKPPKDATRPGGNALAFDWQLIRAETWEKPWILAGGLTPENVAEAVRVSGALAVDVSSGVEDAPGVKNARKIRAFLASVVDL
ncbi:MAG: phosphoribosylanthranilate isomerase [Magnetovibrio sp.]|nr:phosphoribosylanthranilate isomerase [Magnetovibrio sp.]